MADVDSLSAPEASEEPQAAPKRRRGRPRKTESAAQEKITEQPQPTTGTANTEEKTKRRRGRPRKSEIKADNKPDASPMMDTSEQAPASPADGESQAAPKRRRGRPRKVDVEASADVAAKDSASQPKSAQGPQQETITADSGDKEHGTGEVKPRRRRGRPRKNETVDAEMNRLIVQAAPSQSGKPSQPTTSAEDVAIKGALVAPQTPEESTGDSSEISAPRIRRRYTTSAHGDAQQQSKNDAHDVRESSRDRRQNTNQRTSKRRQQAPVEPSLTREMLADMKVAELRAKAAELNLEYLGIRKPDLIEMIYHAAAANEGFRSVEGILQIGLEGYGWVRTGNYMEGDDDAFVHQQIIRHLGLRQGDKIVGTVSPGRANSKYPPLQRVLEVNGGSVENLKSRPRFRDLTPIFPNEPLKLEHGKNSITGRAIDLVAPIGKGQRGLIVSPPKAGKTTILKKICQSISANNPEVYLFCLLVDERPEEVTDMQRSIQGTVVASTFDMPAENHTAVSELVIERAKRLVEMGQDVVVILDSITRLARAYNLAIPASGRILSGGVDSAALYPPKKFLGAARNIEGGGSLTIIASALIDTGSKMDEVIFEEFKGTGNMELKLDRDLADRRIFPAIDPVASGTRNEDLLMKPDYQPLIWGLRRSLANMPTTERATNALIKGLQQTANNEDFLIRSAKKAAELA